MKNQRIVTAYNSINPSAADKERMLRAILNEAAPAPAPQKNREPIVYTAKPTKTSKKSLAGAIAACFAVLIIAGFVLTRMSGQQPTDPSYTQLESPVTTETPYDAVLNKYKTALEEGWSEEQCQIEDICGHITTINYSALDVGYAVIDLDQNGREELVISNGQGLIWDLYTLLEDGTPVHVHSQEDGWPVYRLYENGVICAENFDPLKVYEYYVYQDGAFTGPELTLRQDGSVWYYEQAGEMRQVLTAEEAEAKMAEYKLQELDQRSLLSLVSDEVAEKYKYPNAAEYLEIVNKYRKALEQGWDRTMCVENGLSMLTPIESEYEGLYFAMSDLDGNSVDELIISEYPYRENTDTNFIDIYTVLDGHVIQVMSLGDTDMRYLCEGGIVKDLSAPERGDYNAYVSLWGIQEDQFVQTGAIYNIDGQWYHGFRASEKITAAEAEAEVKSYKPAKLDFIEIKVSDEVEYQTNYEGFDDIIPKYVTAINEGWTAYQCEQNDISPQIFDDTAIQSNLGWCLLDIDSNGIEELIVSDGVHLFDLYVVPPHNGGPGHLIMANGGETWQLCENGVLQMHGLYSGTSVWRYYTLSDIDLVQRDMVFYEGATNQYSYGTYDNDLSPVSKEKAGDIINRVRTAELNLTPFVEVAPFDPNEMEYYEPLLETYRKAIRESWGPGDCAQQGISLMVGYYGDFVKELGYTTMDLDNNGIQELIITDGTNIYDLYTIIQDETTGPLRLIDAMERIEYFLTEDNIIYCRGSGGAAVQYHSLYLLRDRDLVLMDGYAYDADRDPEHPWFHYDGETVGASIGDHDPQPLIDSRKSVEIPFTPFVETPSGEVPVN